MKLQNIFGTLTLIQICKILYETKPQLAQQLIVLITLLRLQALQTLTLTITLAKEWMLHLYQLQTS